MSEKWIFLVDPDSNQFYSLNISTHQIHIEKDVHASMRKKAAQTIRSINQLLKLDHPHWLFESESARNYRYRKLNSYLLKKITCEFPLYLCNSDLSLAFAEVAEIEVEVLLSNYQKEIVELMKKAGNLRPEVKTVDILKVSLLTSADEIIKIVLRNIYKHHEVKLKPKQPGMKFVLRIFGYREYLARGHSMLMYDRIRLILRGGRYLKVMLTEIKKIDPNSELLLPIFERDSEEVKNGIYSEIDWTKFLEAPLFLWYPPFKFPTYKNESSFNQEEYEKNQRDFDEKFYDEISKPRVLNQKCMEEFKETRRQQYRNGIIHLNENNKLYTGECDWVFRVKIMGIENLFKLLEQADDKNQDDDPHKNAIYNGLLTPNYITKTQINKPKEEHLTKSHKRKIKSQEKNKRSLTPKLIKSKERESSYNAKFVSSTEGFFTRHTHHGLIQGCNRFTQLAKIYGLNFTPYLIQINAYLYFGCKLLTEDAIISTTQIHLSQSPKWYQWLEFPVKVSQLPQESRICFDVVVFSSTGDSQIIASSTLQIFDGIGEFKQGHIGLNLWPFYRHEPRFSSSEEFWGLKYTQDHNNTPEKTKYFIATEFARLYVSLDNFQNRMFWSNRDTEMMELLCMPVLKEKIEEVKVESKINQIKNKMQSHMKHLKAVLLQYEELEESENPITVRHDWHDKPTNDDLTKLQKLLNLNPLDMQELEDDEKFILLKCRNHYKTLSKALPIFLSAIDWSDPEQVGEVHKMLKEWAPLTPQEALPLLDAIYADEAVRLYAVERISNFSDDELALYMLELAQALMAENLHFSPLSEFLLERSLSNPFMVGHPFFWNLRSQLHLKPSVERFTLILEQMLMLCGQFREELFSDAKVNDNIVQIAEDIQKSSKNNIMEDKKAELKSMLSTFKSKNQFSNTFCLAIDPRWEVEDFDYDKCNVMNSKKLPLWLNCKNSQKDAPPLKLLFKCGDDLRQDQLAMQLIMIMDKIWLDNGLDFRMKPYRVLATLDQVGMIEVVLNAETTSKIHKTYGGNFGALKESTINDYLKANNKIDKDMEKAIDNFIRSCAGYCVATYILGIGDRHSGNIMVTEKGNLFHIDFGHFLGNFKTKFGIKRERTAFVFTEEMAFVMGKKNSKDFLLFEECCVKGYNLVRKNGHFLISIFMMMLSAGMPELSSSSDLEYLVNQLALDFSEHEACAKFKKEIQESLNSNWRRVDNLFHMLKRD